MAFLKVSMKVGGMGKLQAELDRLRHMLAFRMAKKAARSGGEVILRKVRELTPVDTDHLRPSMGVTMETDAGDNVVTAVVAPRRGYSWRRASGRKLHEPRLYGGFQEEGFWHVRARRHIAAKRFMRRGLFQSRLAALNRVRATLREELRKELG